LFVSDQGLANQVQGIGRLVEEGFERTEIDYAAAPAQLYDTLLSMVTRLKQDYSDGAVWLMSPRVLSAISSIKDENGRLMKDVGPINELFGYKVYCHEGFDATHNQIIFANLERGYTVVENPNILALHDKYTDRRGVRNFFKKLVAGSVTDKAAWVSLRIKDLPAGTLKFY
jgi:HK97 family phage major capsid protein